MALFGKKVNRPGSENVYVLMDSDSRTLARGKRMKAQGSSNLYIKLLEGDVKALSDASVLQVVPQDKSLPPLMARVIDFRESAVALKPMRELGSDVRRNFRVPVAFESFLYPAAGGRAALRAANLSCGGIAFFSPCALAIGNVFELVVPLTSEGPLLLNAQLLRVHLAEDGNHFFACKFIDMIDDEETLLREAVFAVQISAAKARAR
ncbi:MAG: PilZ domain-containing protein [Ruminococcaceae bacterium]|nr:PilZ domain-containing protein [Oscillospiraceae bacterium]